MSPLTVGTHLYDADSDIRLGLIKLILSTADTASSYPYNKSGHLKEIRATTLKQSGRMNRLDHSKSLWLIIQSHYDLVGTAFLKAL